MQPSFCFITGKSYKMNNYGLIRTAAAVPVVKVADTRHNTGEICRMMEEAYAAKASLVVFPELCIFRPTRLRRMAVLRQHALVGFRAVSSRIGEVVMPTTTSTSTILEYQSHNNDQEI